MKLIKLATAALLATMSLSTANAAIYNYGGVDYDVTTITGSFLSLESTLTDQVWWGESGVANDFKNLVGFELGSPNGGGELGPYFAYDTFTIEFTPLTLVTVKSPPTILPQNLLPQFETFTFAIATAVPLPAGGLLLLSGLAGVVGLSRRKKHLA